MFDVLCLFDSLKDLFIFSHDPSHLQIRKFKISVVGSPLFPLQSNDNHFHFQILEVSQKRLPYVSQQKGEEIGIKRPHPANNKLFSSEDRPIRRLKYQETVLPCPKEH